MKRAAILIASVVLWGASSWVHAQRRPLRIEKITDDFYVIFENGGNTGVFITERGVLLVDTKFLPDAAEIQEKVRSVTDKPIRYIINTHHHGDHCQGNPGFPQMVEFVAHENAARRMSADGFFKEPGREKYVPGHVYKDHISFLEGKDRVDVYYFGRGHTDGDSIIAFPRLKIIHTGDLFARRGAPLIDVNGGGSGVEYPKTLSGIVKHFSEKDVEKIVPGHSTIQSYKDLVEFTHFNHDVVTGVGKAVKEGKSLEETQESFRLPEGKYEGYDLGRLKTNVGVIYTELKK